jgi:GNAT superfamily N-acetyltransferase
MGIIMIEGPRSARMEEFDELIAMMTRAYGKLSIEYWASHYPQLYQKDAERVSNFLILKEDGRIVSHVGLFPMELIVYGRRLKVGGIGGVATIQECRGRGFMSQLLNFAIARMRKEGFHLSVLWGDRQRYGAFGWERGVLAWEFLVTHRSLLRSGISKTEVWKYEGSDGDLKSIMRMHEAEPIRVLRSPETYRALLGKAGIEVWLSKDAYLVLWEGRGYAPEFGGDGASILSLIRGVLESKDMPELRISLPLWDGGRFKDFFDASANWSLVTTAMVRVISLSETLGAFASEADAEVLKPLEGEELGLQILEDGEAARLRVEDGSLRVSEGMPNPEAKAPMLSLPRLEMTRLLFCYLKPSLRLGFPKGWGGLFDRMLPLCPYIWSLDHV